MTEQKRVIVTGATGLIGKALVERLNERGYQVVIFSRDPAAARSKLPGAAEYVAWQPQPSGPWQSAIDGAYGIIHLAGASIAGQRWTAQYKQEILDSRILGTRGIVDAIAKASSKPQVLVSSSAIGYYGPRDDSKLDEQATPGNDFLAHVCQEWENEAAKAEKLGIRTVRIRTGIVLDKHEGALSKLLLPFSMFVGGPVLPGNQWWSWIHLADEIGILMLALENQQAHGPINATAPEPQTNQDFSRTLGKVMGRPSLFPVPGFALKIMLGEMADALLISGQRVIPKKAQELGYQFQYNTSEQALRNLL